MNVRYGFTKEVLRKYKKHAGKVLRMIDEVFSWLPLATVVDDAVLIVHGGVSENVDLTFIDSIDRHKYVSVLRPPCFHDFEQGIVKEIEQYDLYEWRQMLDLLWSDPRDALGTVANTFRGGGCFFGPDITLKVLEANKLKMLIRSHECKEEGYEFDHGGRLLTIFSASNYYEENSNKGAYVKVMRSSSHHGDDPALPQVLPIQFMAPGRGQRRLTFCERISHLERSALQNVRELITANQTLLEEKFRDLDPLGNGRITALQWCQAMEAVLMLDVPWRMLRPRLVTSSSDMKDHDGQHVEYMSTFNNAREISLEYAHSGPTVTEMLYGNLTVLETIFRTFDRDNSGHISMTEFTDACDVMQRHAGLSLQPGQVEEIAESLDLNNDGIIDFNEFMEAFRIVDSRGKRNMAATRDNNPSSGSQPDSKGKQQGSKEKGKSLVNKLFSSNKTEPETRQSQTSLASRCSDRRWNERGPIAASEDVDKSASNNVTEEDEQSVSFSSRRKSHTSCSSLVSTGNTTTWDLSPYAQHNVAQHKDIGCIVRDSPGQDIIRSMEDLSEIHGQRPISVGLKKKVTLQLENR